MVCFIIVIIIGIFAFLLIQNASLISNDVKNNEQTSSQSNTSVQNSLNTLKQNVLSAEEQTPQKKYIKWFEFKPSYDVLLKTSNLDITSHTKNESVKYNWIELISYLACKYGNDFSKFKQKKYEKCHFLLKNKVKL